MSSITIPSLATPSSETKRTTTSVTTNVKLRETTDISITSVISTSIITRIQTTTSVTTTVIATPTISPHPLKHLLAIISKETNCGKDLVNIILSFDTIDINRFNMLKFDLSKEMKDRADRELVWEKINYEDGESVDCVVDYEIRSIIHGNVFNISFAKVTGKYPYEDCDYFSTEITYNGCIMDQIFDTQPYSKKSWNRYTIKEFDEFLRLF